MNVWRIVGRSAAIQVLVAAVSGVMGILTSRLIIGDFGVSAYAQYGLIATLPNLLPFVDLGIAAVIVNNIAGSADPRRDPQTRATITSAFRILLMSASVVILVSIALLVFGVWPAILGEGLLPGGGLVAAICLCIFALTLPLAVGQRLLVALGRNPLAAGISGLTAPLVFSIVVALSLVGPRAGTWVPIASYVATAVVCMLWLIAASRLLHPQVGRAWRDVPHFRIAPGVKVKDTAWPMLVQMVSLPIAMQTGRILLSHRGTPEDLASYSLGYQVFSIALQAIYTGGVALWPYFAKARSEGRITSPASATMVFTAAGAAAALVIAAASPWVTAIVAHGKILLPTSLVVAFVCFVTLQAIKYPLGMYMTGTKGLRFQVIPVIVMVPVNVGLTWALIPPLGASGVVFASSLTILTCQVLPNLWWIRRELRSSRAPGQDSLLKGHR